MSNDFRELIKAMEALQREKDTLWEKVDSCEFNMYQAVHLEMQKNKYMVVITKKGSEEKRIYVGIDQEQQRYYQRMADQVQKCTESKNKILEITTQQERVERDLFMSFLQVRSFCRSEGITV